MQTIEVSAKVANPEEGVSGEEFTVSAVGALQGVIRNAIKAKKSGDEIQKIASEWKPGLRARGKSPQEKLMDQFQKLSPEERARLLETFMSQGSEAA
jgi:hypothetical protein